MEATAPISDIPHLPEPAPGMTWRALNQFKEAERGADFYFTCLQYGQHLWREKLPARAILCLDRAWGAALTGEEPVLREWPLPYRALVYLLRHAPEGVFLGNPRVHFQHYADRLGEPRREQRKWRSWACWALSRAACPDLPGDPKHEVVEPSHKEIRRQLEICGHPGEAQLWQEILEETR